MKVTIEIDEDELLSRCVDKASAELTRKALPKLLEKLTE